MTRARALWIVDEGHAELRDEELAPPSDGEVLVRTAYTAISRGTEALVIGGLVPDSLRDVMRAPFQAGRFPWPVKYGYCNVGVVEAGAVPAGTEVFTLFPHQDRFVVPASAVHPLPVGVPAARAVLAANLETALNVVWDGGIGPADRVTVVGGGVVGSLVAWLAGRIPGTDVQLVDLRPDRAGVAEALGVGFVLPEDADGDRDVVVEASGSADGLATALRLAAFEATVVVASWYGAGPVAAPLGEAFHARRLHLRSSQVGAVSPARAPRFPLARRLRAALGLLGEGAVLDCMVDGETPFDELPQRLPWIASAAGPLCHRIRY